MHTNTVQCNSVWDYAPVKLECACAEVWIYECLIVRVGDKETVRECERESQRMRKSTFHPYVQMSDKVCGRLRLLLPLSLILSQLVMRLDLFDPTGSLIPSLC